MFIELKRVTEISVLWLTSQFAIKQNNKLNDNRDMSMKTFGENLEEYLNSHRLSVRKFAKEIGVSPCESFYQMGVSCSSMS